MIRPSRAIWLCLRFEALALEVFADSSHGGALAVIEHLRVHASNMPQLTPGLALGTAQALQPDLSVRERQPQWEQETLHNLAHWAYHFTPDIGIAAGNCLLLEIGSCRRLYHGIAPLLHLLQSELENRGHRTAVGLAHTPKAAWLLAHSEQLPALHRTQRLDLRLLQQQLDELPVALLPVDAKIGTALAHMGINSLGALSALPLAALGKRFGAAFIHYLQQLWGAQPDPQPAFVPTAAFTHSLAFIDGIHNRQMLQFPMKRLLQILCDYLVARQLHCRVLHWRLYDAHTLQAELSIELSRTQNHWRTFLELSRLRLDTVPLRDAVYTLTLASDSFSAAAPGSLNLFADEQDTVDAGHALLDRLRARLGGDALQQLGSRDAHWPELAWQTLPAGTTGGADTPAAKGPRPLWLLPAPVALRTRDARPVWRTPLQLLRGPERIGNHWWQESAQQRDYYVACNDNGMLCWVFQEQNSGSWFMHGLFA